MERLLSRAGAVLYGMGFTRLFFCVGLVALTFGMLGKFLLETCELMSTLLFDELGKIGLYINVLAPVDMKTVTVIHITFVLSAIGMSFAECSMREKT